jgi:putative transposase
VRPPDRELRARLRELAEERRRWGYRMLHVLLEREGQEVNHKRVYRLYREERLQVRRRRRRKRAIRPRRALETPSTASERWSMDFIHDELATGRRLRCLTVVDDCTREAVAIEVAHSIPGEQVAEVLDRAGLRRGLPGTIVCDNGPDFTSRCRDQWAHDRGIALSFIRPGKPVENAFVESFNGTFREECLNEHWFLGLREAKREIEAWKVDSNRVRPNSSLGNLTPVTRPPVYLTNTSTLFAAQPPGHDPKQGTSSRAKTLTSAPTSRSAEVPAPILSVRCHLLMPVSGRTEKNVAGHDRLVGTGSFSTRTSSHP